MSGLAVAAGACRQGADHEPGSRFGTLLPHMGPGRARREEPTDQEHDDDDDR